VIDHAQTLYNYNRSAAIAYACEGVSQLADNMKKVLHRDDLTRQQRCEIADTLSTSTLVFETNVDITAILDTGQKFRL